MSLFRYFGREKVKAVGDNNNLEATKKDDDQSNATATGVAKSTAELGKAQESSRKRCRTFQETWKTRRPWLKFDEKENAMFCSYCRQLSKDKSAFGSGKTTGHRLVKTAVAAFLFHFLVQINKSHCLATCISFLA